MHWERGKGKDDLPLARVERRLLPRPLIFDRMTLQVEVILDPSGFRH